MNLYKSPANKFVAGFIGSPAMNFLSGLLTHDGQFSFTNDTGICKIDLGVNVSSELEQFAGRKVSIGIRPEDIILSQDNSIACHCKLNVLATENMGNEQLVYVLLDNKTLIVRKAPGDTIEPGTEIGINFLKKQNYLF